jgi:structure-specific recognition protein 1
MRVLVGRKITSPGEFRGKNKTTCVPCSYKASAGFVYPLDRSFLYIHKPQVIYVRFEEIASVNFARSGGSTRSFDIEVELKSGSMYTFSSIAKDEQGNLYEFISKKGIKIQSKGKVRSPHCYCLFSVYLHQQLSAY